MKSATRTRRSAIVPLGADEPRVAQAHSEAILSGFGGWGQGWSGADWSPDRGFVYWPNEDTRRDLPTYSLYEMRRRSRFLDANVGFAGRINRGIARMVCGTGLMVRPTTRARDWNRERTELFKQRNGTAAVVDLGRKWDFYSMQRGMLECRNVDGDIGSVLSKSQGGLARVAFIEAHRIGNGRSTQAEVNRLIDGVLVDRNNAPYAYRVLGDNDTQVDVPVENFCYLGDAGRPGRQRTPPRCHRALNHLLDRTEIDRHFKKAIKNSSRIGYYIGTESTQTAKSSGLPRTPVDRTTKTTPSGRRLNVDQVMDGGGEIPDLDPGQDIKLLLDQRPHPNTMGFYDHLARDISWGTDWPPELLWNIVKLGSAGTRYVMAEAQGIIEAEQQILIDAILSRYYLYDTCLEVAAGRLRPCPDPEWYRHEFLPPSRWTIDRGRDGKLHLEMVRSAALTFRRMLGWEGLDAETELNEWLDEMKMIADGAKARGLDPDRTIERVYGRAGISAAVAAEVETDPEAAKQEAEQ